MEIRTLEKIINFNILRKAALCTQVEWRGSVPRKDYPMMLVEENGNIIGTIGGGELEYTVINLAQNTIKTDKPVLQKFDLTNQDLTKSGSICGGSTTILVEPFSKTIQKVLSAIINFNNINNNVLITKISSKNEIIVERFIFTKDYQQYLPPQIISAIEKILKQKKSNAINHNDESFLIQYIGNRPILHIFGAGHVGKSVADLAQFIELDTNIYDERPDLANSTRFPFALQIYNSEIKEIIKNSNIAQTDYVLVATRGHQNDFEIMRWLLKLKIDYLSLVSSKNKWKLLRQTLGDDGFTEDQINSVHSPVGLDIGSETVPEIAMSIMAEIVNHYRNNRKSEISLSKL